MTFYDVFLKLCTQRGIKPGTAAKEIPISKSIITRWKKGEGNPTDATLAKIAAYFECPIEDLRVEKEITATIEGDGLTETQRALIEKVMHMTDDQAAAFLASATWLEAQRKDPGSE